MQRDEHRHGASHRHAEQEEVTDQADAQELPPHATESPEHRRPRQQHPAQPGAGAGEDKSEARDVLRRYPEHGRGGEQRDPEGAREKQQRDADGPQGVGHSASKR